MITHLPVLVPPPPDKPGVSGPDHPMRRVTRETAFDPQTWTPERRNKVEGLFDSMAAEWNEHDGIGRHDALIDALDRGFAPGGDGDPEFRRCLEVGAGTGLGTRYLAPLFDHVVALDLSRGMLRQMPDALASRVHADSSCLPLASASIHVVVLVNMLLFPAEIDRVLASDGILVWVNSLGDRTPIHLSAEDVAAALPGEWHGIASEAGWGTWCLLNRGKS